MLNFHDNTGMTPAMIAITKKNEFALKENFMRSYDDMLGTSNYGHLYGKKMYNWKKMYNGKKCITEFGYK